MKYSPIDPEGLHPTDLEARPSLVSIEALGRPVPPGATFAEWLASLPDAPGVRAVRGLAEAIVQAHAGGKPVVFAMGAHLVKCGVGPVVCDLIRRGVVTAIAMNGAGLVHDAELALAGKTSEDVAASLPDGSFGMARQTAELINGAAASGAAEGVGLGEAAARALAAAAPPNPSASVLLAALQADIPITVHVAVGTDVVHMHPSADGAAIGATSMTDFRLLTAVVADMGSGGVFANIGSAVIMPEVFLKCVSLARNLGHDVTGIVTANLDFIQHYRPSENVLRRPVADPASRSFAITGHHEILVPLLAQAVIEALP